MEESIGPDLDIWDQVEAVLNSGKQAGFALTGGGSQTITWLLNHPGASRFVIEIQVPYHSRALEAYLQRPGPHSASEETARCMALRARRRGVEFTQTQHDILGLSCTAALATRRVRRGHDRGCIGLRLDKEYLLYTVEFVKGAAERLEQEEVLSRFVLQVLADATGVAPLRVDQWPEWVAISQSNLPVDEVLEDFLDGGADLVEVHQNGVMDSHVERAERLLFPGSFNPFHQGHAGLAAAVAKHSGRQVALELAVENVDKPVLSYEEVYTRIQRIDGQLPIVVTRAATFVEKARLFPGCHFAVGYDTALRLVEAKYYDGGEVGMRSALTEMAGARCKFWVAGRLSGDRYMTLADIQLPPEFTPLFEAIPEEEFRADISSSQIRAERSH